MLYELARNDDGFNLILMLIVFGATGIYNGYRSFVHRRKVEDTACSTIASAPMGLAEVQGHAWPTKALRSLDGRAACYWRLVVEEERGSGKNRKWVQVFSFATSDLVLVTDKTGTCALHPDRAEWELTKDVHNGSSFGEVARQVISAQAPGALQYLSGSGLLGLVSKSTRFTEVRLLAGSPIYVRGNFTAVSSNTQAVAVGDYSGFHSQMPKISSPQYALKMFDRNLDGVINEEEMTIGYSMAANPYLREAKTKAESVKLVGHFLADATHGLYVADTHQEYLVKRLQKKFRIYLYGGFAMFAIGVYLFLERL